MGGLSTSIIDVKNTKRTNLNRITRTRRVSKKKKTPVAGLFFNSEHRAIFPEANSLKTNLR